MDSLDALLPDVEWRAECPPEIMADFLEIVGQVPHADYLRFMQAHEGCDGPVGEESYIRIWTLDEVVERTEAAEEFAPGLLLFAGDGGDKAYAFDRQDPRWPIVSISLTSISPEDTKQVAETFEEFLRRLAADEL